MGRGKYVTEVVDHDSPQAEAIAVLRYYLDRAKRGELVGIMVIAETTRGGYQMSEIKMTSSENVAERVGRLELLKEAVLDSAHEEGE